MRIGTALTARGGRGPDRPTPARLTPMSARGFTLLELVVVAAVSSVLFLILIRWVLTLTAAASVTLDNAAEHRAADVATAAFSRDLSRAERCAPGEPSPLREIAPDRVTLTVTRPTAPGVTDQVVWQVTAQANGHWSLTRSVARNADLPDRCQFGPVAGTRTYTDRAAAVDAARIVSGAPGPRPAFAALVDGHDLTDPEHAWGPCPALTSTGVPAARCAADGLSIDWVFETAVAEAAPVTVSASYLFPHGAGGLS